MQIITPKLCWPYDGHNYDTELEAIEANLKAIGQRIAKNHSASPVTGLLAFRDDLAPLLMRHAELTAKEPEGTHSESLEGTQKDGKLIIPENVCLSFPHIRRPDDGEVEDVAEVRRDGEPVDTLAVAQGEDDHG